MSPAPQEQPWHPASPSQFVDRRTSLRRGTGTRLSQLVQQNVRAWHGVIVRSERDGERRGPVYDRCPHAHSKPGSARKCGEAAAKRLNRAISKGEDWAWLPENAEGKR